MKLAQDISNLDISERRNENDDIDNNINLTKTETNNVNHRIRPVMPKKALGYELIKLVIKIIYFITVILAILLIVFKPLISMSLFLFDCILASILDIMRRGLDLKKNIIQLFVSGLLFIITIIMIGVLYI